MLCTSSSLALPLLCSPPVAAILITSTALPCPLRYDHDDNRRQNLWNGNGIVKKPHNLSSMSRRGKLSSPVMSSSSASPLYGSQQRKDTSQPNLCVEVLKAARESFTQEISFQSKDKDISLAKYATFRGMGTDLWYDTLLDLWYGGIYLIGSFSVGYWITKALLYVAAEDEAFMAFNREMDARSFHSERKHVSVASDVQEWTCLEAMLLAGKTIYEWLGELDAIAKEVRVELESRDIGCHLAEVLEAVNVVLFESRGFKRPPVLVDSKYSYLHSALSFGCGSAILLSVIYIEVCRRLGLTIVGSRVGEEFLIWPQTENPEELFRATSGHSLFAVVNGRCVDDPRSKASDLNSNSLLTLDIATNRDIIGIALANLIRLHWKRASRMCHGLMLASPLRPVHDLEEKLSNSKSSNAPLLRPQYLRLAIMASERLLILQPHNWALRRDHGMMLYYNRDYGEAVQELSICMAFAPEEEAELLEPFVEKLHLLRLEASWKSLGHNTDRLKVP